MNLSDFQLIRLTNEYEFKPFDCKDQDLNEFLLNDSKDFLNSLIAVTYILESGKDIVAFFSLFNDRISAEDFESNRKWRSFRDKSISPAKRFKSYPAVKIGRLAVSHHYKGNNIGTAMLDYIKEWFVDNNRTGCKFITVDAYEQSLLFYEKAGFKYLTNKDLKQDTRAMYFDLLPFVKS